MSNPPSDSNNDWHRQQHEEFNRQQLRDMDTANQAVNMHNNAVNMHNQMFNQ